MVARKRAGLPPLGGVGLKDESGIIPELLPSVADEEIEQLPADIYTKGVDLGQGKILDLYRPFIVLGKKSLL